MKTKPKRLVYKTDDGIFYKDRFMGYVLFSRSVIDAVSINIDTLLKSNDFQESISKKEQVVFTNKEALVNIALSLVQPFLLENHRGIAEQSIQIVGPDNKTIDLGYPNPLFVSINDPSGDIINIDPSGFFGFVYNCVTASLTQNNIVHTLIFSNENPKEISDYDINLISFCARLAGDITDNIVNTLFSISEDGSTFKQTFQASYSSFSWYTRDFSKFFNCSFKIEFINFRNFNKDFDESKVCRLFSISNKRKYLLMCCSIKVHLENTTYMGRIEDQKSKQE